MGEYTVARIRLVQDRVTLSGLEMENGEKGRTAHGFFQQTRGSVES